MFTYKTEAVYKTDTTRLIDEVYHLNRKTLSDYSIEMP